MSCAVSCNQARLACNKYIWTTLKGYEAKGRHPSQGESYRGGGETIINMEAYVVPEISSIPNTHVELVKSDYPHLKGLWFSDVSMGRDEMVIDVLVGADYLWHFQKG